MKLYELTGDFSDLYNRFIDIDAWEPDTDADGQPIDENGEVIENLTAYKEELYQAWFDTVMGTEEIFEDTALFIALCIKEKRSNAEQLKAEKQKLALREKKEEKAADRLEQYLLKNMQAIGRTEIDRPQAKIRIKQNPESTVIDDEQEFIKWAECNDRDDLLKYEQPSVKKAVVKALLKKKEKIPFAHLERKTVLEIK